MLRLDFDESQKIFHVFLRLLTYCAGSGRATSVHDRQWRGAEGKTETHAKLKSEFIILHEIRNIENHMHNRTVGVFSRSVFGLMNEK